MPRTSTPDRLNRRSVLTAGVAAAAGAPWLDRNALGAESRARPPVHICTQEHAAWRDVSGNVQSALMTSWLDMDVMLQPEQAFQTMDGFGGCFSELGWVALSALPADQRDNLLRELFAPGVGAGLSYCRLPIGANDYARNWYSCDETPGDFTLAHFSIARDEEMQIPFIKAARGHQPNLKLWASPWSPPSWMKTNGHYADAHSVFHGVADNGLRDDQVIKPGQDAFIQEERYFAAYARYFARFVEAYRAHGLNISMVTPQNEFNSNQFFPSCFWTPRALARFIPHLGREMTPLGVEVFFGTLERGDPALLEAVLAEPEAAKYIKGVAAQWAGRRAIPFIHHDHPQLKIFQSEQECGDGKNDWRFARYSWTMMKAFMQAGAQTYDYWNIATPKGGESAWGWRQNAFISVDTHERTFEINHDYQVFKHLSAYVQTGARRIDTLSISGYENLLAFSNPDGSTVVVAQNDMSQPIPLRIALNGRVHVVILAQDSFNTLVL